jgi:hypothetical protein
VVPEAGTGLARLGSRDRTGQKGQDSWTGQQEKTVGIINQDRKMDKTVKKSQYSKYRLAWTGHEYRHTYRHGHRHFTQKKTKHTFSLEWPILNAYFCLILL